MSIRNKIPLIHVDSMGQINFQYLPLIHIGYHIHKLWKNSRNDSNPNKKQSSNNYHSNEITWKLNHTNTQQEKLFEHIKCLKTTPKHSNQKITIEKIQTTR
jgi:hypothetical protein